MKKQTKFLVYGAVGIAAIIGGVAWYDKRKKSQPKPERPVRVIDGQVTTKPLIIDQTETTPTINLEGIQKEVTNITR
jgi:hypothetical protein